MAFSGPVFLVGCPRSGTTLLQRMLDAHSQVAIAPETHFVRRFWLARDRYGDLSTDANFARVIDDFISMPEFAEMGLDRAAFRDTALSGERSTERLFRLLLDGFARLRRATIVGEKTPNHLLYMPALESIFPDARFIHIVRDPRAVVNSWRNVPWSTGGVIGDAFVWRRYMATARRHPPRGAKALMVIAYEDLVADAEATLTKICQFIGVAFEGGMCAFHDNRPSTLNVAREPWKKGANEPLDSGRLEAWRDELSGSAIARIEVVARGDMRRLGYIPLSSTLASLSLTLPVWFNEYLRRGFRRCSGHQA